MALMEKEIIPYEKRRDFLLARMKKQDLEEVIKKKAEEKNEQRKLKSISRRYR